MMQHKQPSFSALLLADEIVIPSKQIEQCTAVGKTLSNINRQNLVQAMAKLSVPSVRKTTLTTSHHVELDVPLMVNGR